MTRDILSRTGQWDSLKQKTRVFTGTVAEAANDLKIGATDAAFIWDAMATQYPEFEVIALPALRGAESKLIVGVLKSSKQPVAAAAFARYLASPGSGLVYFKKFGFTVPPERR